MGRPATITDDERMYPHAVSLDKARREKLKTLGGSAWLRAAIDSATAGDYRTDSRCTWRAIGKCSDCGRVHDGKPNAKKART